MNIETLENKIERATCALCWLAYPAVLGLIYQDDTARLGLMGLFAVLSCTHCTLSYMIHKDD